MTGLNLEDGKMEVDGMDYVENKKDELGVEIHSGRTGSSEGYLNILDMKSRGWTGDRTD